MKSFLLAALVAIVTKASAQTAPDGQVPKAGYVPNASTAVSIAEAVLLPLYGSKAIRRERPFRAELRSDSVWVVHSGRYTKGGSYVEISKRDGRILEATIGK
ncbi:NTF2 fold immunity protein [Hymenobacter monticola]|uniref:YbbC/YhhH family protein n=1 Tax=Hymenobacter monticola TaxID=1705399 RepID=A0ABY4B9V1_9BACT|nr:NTF2 fold immunity protein [Hymenobacter monticola]UOE35534.1 YbbC/YhhH family protein [Hymenobacter monticola]